MFGFGKKNLIPRTERARFVGVDLNATRARAIAAGDGRTRLVQFDGEHEELPLCLTLDQRRATIGAAAKDQLRKSPHSVCANYLGLLGKRQDWRGPKLTLTPESATQLTLDHLHAVITAESDVVALGLPAYMTPPQVAKLQELAAIARLPLVCTAATSLAIAAHRAAFVLAPKAPTQYPQEPEEPDVLPLRNQDPGSGAVVIIDIDDHALSAQLIQVNTREVQLQSTAEWHRASLRFWYDRIIDMISDRCVLSCRRDPRDSGEAEQSLFDLCPRVLEQTRQRQLIRLSVRAAHWYQDLVLQPEDVEIGTNSLLSQSLDCLRHFLQTSALPSPPRAVWLTHAAGLLPGLAAKLFKHSPEQTSISILPVNAGAEAIAALVPRWLNHGLPNGHLDGNIPLDSPVTHQAPARPSANVGKVRKG